MEKLVLENEEAVARKALELLSGPVAALSGGSTFARMYPYWSSEPSLKKVQFFPVDERRVPFDHEGCNWRVTTEHLLEPLGLESQKAHWAQNGQQYLDLLLEKLGPQPRFDQIYLGTGGDGHTASLFPGGDYLTDSASLVLETESPKPPHPRVTLAFKPLWEASQLILLVTGSGKREIVSRILAGDETLPVVLALKGHPHPVILMDRAAAGE